MIEAGRMAEIARQLFACAAGDLSHSSVFSAGRPGLPVFAHMQSK